MFVERRKMCTAEHNTERWRRRRWYYEEIKAKYLRCMSWHFPK